MPHQGRTLPSSRPPVPAATATIAPITTDAQRGAGTLTPAEVRTAVARFLTPHEVAALAHAAADRTTLRRVTDEIRSQFRGYAGGGVICNATARGLAVEVNRAGDEHGGLVSWRLLARVVADGAAPRRVAALDDALTRADQQAAREAAEALVLAGPAATQLDLLDALPDLPDLPDPAVVEEPPAGEQPRPQRKARTRTSDGTSSRT